MDIIIRANIERFEEAKNMCDALRELFAEELEEEYQKRKQQFQNSDTQRRSLMEQIQNLE